MRVRYLLRVNEAIRRPLFHRNVSIGAAYDVYSSSQTASNPGMTQGPGLQGQVYLIPTVSIERNDTVETVQEKVMTTNRIRQNPVVLDLSNVSNDGTPHFQPIKQSRLHAIVRRLRECELFPIGITNAGPETQKIAKNIHLPSLIPTNASHDLHIQHMCPVEEHVEPDAEEHEPTDGMKLTPPMIVESSVRTGQQVYAKGTSLVVMGSVNSGAEVLADGDIHVFGALRGRALAGVQGNMDAHIFAYRFDAELVSISDSFTTCDELEKTESDTLTFGQPTYVSLKEGELSFKSSVAPKI